MIRIAYLIRSLETGGAERQLVALARGLDPALFQVSVLTFYSQGELAADLAQSGVDLVSLEKSGRWDLPGFLGRLREALRETGADILHSYLTTANLMALLTRSCLPRAKLVWGKRASAMDLSHYDFWSGATDWLEARLAGRSDLVIVNSEAGRRDYIARGAGRARIEVVPNGIDTERFLPRPEARGAIRAELGIEAEAPLIGILARLDPMKGHGVFLEAAALALQRRPDLRFLCIGGGEESQKAKLHEKAEGLGLGGALVWAGARRDVPEVLSALDLHSSASIFGEGFSNATGEAMAAGIPCVVTDIGDSAQIVGDTGRVVAAEDAAALAAAWLELLDQPDEARAAMGRRARERVVTLFSLDAMVARTAALYRGLLGVESEERAA